MLRRLYAKWMFAWETRLTTRDTNRIVRPLEWGFEWLPAFEGDPALTDLDRMIALNEQLAGNPAGFFGYKTPSDFRIEKRHPQLFPTNVRPETLAQDADYARLAAQVDRPAAATSGGATSAAVTAATSAGASATVAR